MSARDGNTMQTDNLVRLQASVGLGILAVSGVGLVTNALELPWSVTHQAITAALGIATGWKALGATEQ